jgi:hypothetical protein
MSTNVLKTTPLRAKILLVVVVKNAAQLNPSANTATTAMFDNTASIQCGNCSDGIIIAKAKIPPQVLGSKIKVAPARIAPTIAKRSEITISFCGGGR